MAVNAGRYHSFLIRILSRDGNVLHGQITHIATRETARFKDPQRMMDFIAEHMAGADHVAESTEDVKSPAADTDTQSEQPV